MSKPYTLEECTPPKGFEHARPTWDRLRATVEEVERLKRELEADKYGTGPLRKRLAAAEAKVKELEKELEDMAGEKERQYSRAAELEKEVRQLTDQAESNRARAEQAEAEACDDSARAADLERQCAELKQYEDEFVRAQEFFAEELGWLGEDCLPLGRIEDLRDERDAALATLATVERERDEARAEYHRENLAAAALQEKLDAARAALLEVVAEVLDAKRIATNINAAADQSDNGPELALLESLDEALAILEKEKP